MTMALHKPSPPNVPSWLAVGVRVRDTAVDRTGVVQLLRDELGEIRTGAIQHPTRALLRPVGRLGPPWWAHVTDLDQPPRSER